MESQNTVITARRNDLDWIRVIAVLLLVPFHAALIFILSPYAVMYVKDVEDSRSLDIFAGWIHQYHMPILFYVAGASTFFALAKRSGGQYIKERFLKLLVPAIAGLVLLIPPMTYIWVCAHGSDISFIQHFIGFWHINPADLNGLSGCFTPAHLWFLIYLFIFSLIALPLFLVLRRDKVLAGIKKTVDAIGSFGVILILVILSLLAARTYLLGDINPIYYFLIFITGYIFMADERIQKSIDKSAPYMLVLGMIFEAARHMFLYDICQWAGSDIPGFFIEQMNRWFWLLALLGFGHRLLRNRNSLLTYLSASSFPFYIFHMIVTTLVGCVIVRLQTEIWIKYLAIVVLSILLTFLVYEIVRRIPVIRFIFGIRKKTAPKETVKK